MRAIRGALLLGVAMTVLGVPVRAQEVPYCLYRVFASVGGMTPSSLRIDPSGAENQGHEIARFWQSSNSTLNNFSGGCPSQSSEQDGGGWWESNMPPLRAIKGAIGEPGCDAGCPNGEMTILVEEQDVLGWSAYFIALRVDQTPQAYRWFDFARLAPDSPAVLTMVEYPPPVPIASHPNPDGGLLLEILYPDVAAGVHAVIGPSSNTPLPASAVLKSYDLYKHVGPDVPGRETSEWTLVNQHPYEDGPSTVTFPVGCPPVGGDVHFALGLTFRGGEGPDVRSVLLGRQLTVDCGPILPPTPAGEVPDGHEVAGIPLRVDRAPGSGTDLKLTWDSSCNSNDVDYAVYEGPLGDFGSHDPVMCSTDGELSATFTPSSEDSYYLVVPVSPVDIPVPAEGSYGRRSDGEERPQNLFTACYVQEFGGCP
jgi:hypothetical protein